MKIVKENKVQEAVKPMDFSVQFTSWGDKRDAGEFTVFVDGHKKGMFQTSDTHKFIKLKLDFMKKFEALLKWL